MTFREKLFLCAWGLVIFPVSILFLDHTPAVIIAILGYMGHFNYLFVKDSNAV